MLVDIYNPPVLRLLSCFSFCSLHQRNGNCPRAQHQEPPYSPSSPPLKGCMVRDSGSKKEKGKDKICQTRNGGIRKAEMLEGRTRSNKARSARSIKRKRKNKGTKVQPRPGIEGRAPKVQTRLRTVLGGKSPVYRGNHKSGGSVITERLYLQDF